MKKTFIAGFVIAIIGAILMGLGYTHKGNKDVTWQDGGFKVRNEKTLTKTFKDVQNLDLNTSDYVEVKNYDGSDFKVSYRDYNKVSYNAKKHQVSVTGSTGSSSIGFFFNDDFNPNITIYVPKNAELNAFSGNAHGGIKITGLKFNQLNISSDGNVDLSSIEVKDALKLGGESNLNLNNIQAPLLIANTNNGDINVNDSEFKSETSAISTKDGDVSIKETTLKNSKVSSSDGNIKFSQPNVIDKITATTSDGDIDASLKGRNDLSIRINTSDGTPRIFDKNTSYYDQGNRTTLYEFNSADGDVTVQ